MQSRELNYMAQTLADIYTIGKETKVDELMEELIRVATQEGVPDNELNAAKELYSKDKEDREPICDTLKTDLIFSCMENLFWFIKGSQGRPQWETTFILYSTLLDHWMSVQPKLEEQQAEDEGKELIAGRENCANCMWRTKKGKRCGNMVSGYFPNFMQDTEECIGWEANPTS